MEIPPPSTASERYTSPLMVAATLDNVDVARLLIEKGADVKRKAIFSEIKKLCSLIIITSYRNF